MSDLAIIGAGPAGMAAAATAAEAGLSVVLLDEQPRPGGQIYRDVERVAEVRGDLLGPEYTDGSRLTRALRHSNIHHIGDAVVWAIEDGWRISYTRQGRATQITASHVLLATGALERPMPMPGWTLPGVMTAGAAQILLKQSGILPRRAVLVGCGPLIYLIAAQMVRAGSPPLALVETQTRGDLLRGLRHLPGALRGWPYLRKGLHMLAEIRRAGVPRFTGARGIAIHGDNKAHGVTFRSGGQMHDLRCDTVLLHHGVVPNMQAALSMEVAHTWSESQLCFVPVTDDCGRTGKTGIFIAGDSAGIGGAIVAEHAGRLAALEIAVDLGRLSQSAYRTQSEPLRRALQSHRAIRPFLDTAFPPLAEALTPADEVIVCRCEEVTAGDIRRFAGMGCLGPNQTKAFGRAGMGPCQGRYCGLTVSSLLTQAHDQSPDDTGYFRIRAPLKPVTLGELAALHDET